MQAVTFYSYKGGVGRSLLVANCALYLAQLGLRVVALDLDLEAPGLHYKFRTALGESFPPSRGLIDLIDRYSSENQLYESLNDVSFDVPLGDPMLEPNSPPPRGWLRVIPAGSAPSANYWRRVANVDWKRFLYDEGATGVEFFIDLRDRITEEFGADLLLIDSRTGITEMGNVATSVLADKVICIVTDVAENIEGARVILRGLRRHRRLSDGAPIDMKIAVSRPHSSVPLADRLEKIRAFFEEPADMLDATLDVGTPYPLAYDPDVERKEQLVLGGDLGRMGQLCLDYMAIADEIIPESLWKGISTLWAPGVQSPYPYTVWSYSRLALEQPGIPLDGLYRVGRRCFIVIPGFGPEMRAKDGKTLSNWFSGEKAMGAPIQIVDRVPIGALHVAEPSLEDLIALRDAPLTMREIDVELCLRLPRTFPEFHFRESEDFNHFIVEVERPLQVDERSALRRVLASLTYGPSQRPVIRVNPDIGSKKPTFRFAHGRGDIDLIPSRRLPSAFSQAVRDMVAKDEDLWMSQRTAIQRGEISHPSSVLPPWAAQSKARFLVGLHAFIVPGAHRLLPFCDQLILSLPLEEQSDARLAEIGFTREELIALAHQGRVIVLLPQAIDRYEPALLNELVEQAPGSLVCSRALCAATMIELRRRLYPWFFPGFDLRERRDRLHRAAMRKPLPFEEHLGLFYFHPGLFSKFLSHVWAREEMHTHLKGAKASLFLGGGFGTLLADQIEHQLKRDLLIESGEAGSMVETAAALGAMVVPMHRPEFSLLGLTNAGAALLSSLSDASVRSTPPLTLELPARGRSAGELARFDGEELRTMRALLAGLTEGAADNAVDPMAAGKACKHWLLKANALTERNGKLTIAGPGLNPESRPSSKANGVIAVQWIRDVLAGADLGSPPDLSGDPGSSASFPPLLVGEFESPAAE